MNYGTPQPQGLYHPRNEHDSCGIGFVANIDGKRSHRIVEQGLEILLNLTHRGAVGADPDMGDGAGLLLQMPHRFLAEVAAADGIALPAPAHTALAPCSCPGTPESVPHAKPRSRSSSRPKARPFWAGVTCP